MKEVGRCHGNRLNYESTALSSTMFFPLSWKPGNIGAENAPGAAKSTIGPNLRIKGEHKMNKIEKSRIEEIRRLHDEIFGSFKISLEKAIRFGQLLNEQKDKLQHGEFTTWVDDNLPFAERTAQNYMRVYRERDKFKTETVSDLTSAYKLLIEHKDTKETRPSVPSTAMDVSRKEAEYRDHVDKAVFYSDELRVDVTTKNSESEFLKDADWMVLGVEGSPDTNNFPKDSKLFFRERKNEDRAFVEKKGV